MIAVALSDMPFALIADAKDEAANIVLLEHKPRAFQLAVVDNSNALERLSWVTENFSSAQILMNES